MKIWRSTADLAAFGGGNTLSSPGLFGSGNTLAVGWITDGVFTKEIQNALQAKAVDLAEEQRAFTALPASAQDYGFFDCVVVSREAQLAEIGGGNRVIDVHPEAARHHAHERKLRGACEGQQA